MELHLALMVIGGLLLLGLAADALGRRTRIPRVTLLILLGVALGKPGFDLLPGELVAWHEFLATAALTMVAFVLGGHMTRQTLSAHGTEIVTISIAVVVASAVFVVAGLLAIGVALPTALVLGGIATATAPAATRDVIRQAAATGPFAERLTGIVAIDDAWGLVAFGVLLVMAKSLLGDGDVDVTGLIAEEFGLSLVVGLSVGLPAAMLTGRLRPGEPMQIEALGVVFVCAGLAVWVGASFLLSGMVAGALVANLARHHDRPFHEIENIQAPFLILFFLLAGATVETPRLGELGLVCAVYIVLRVIGRLIGALAGGRMSGMSARESLWTGAALTPQAGVALGMALVAADQLPGMSDTVIAITIATTVFFEIAGPFLTMLALGRAGRLEMETEKT